jgi:hypothetical protein
MSEETRKVEQTEQVSPASELSEQDLEEVAGGAPAATTPKPTTTCFCQPIPGKSW